MEKKDRTTLTAEDLLKVKLSLAQQQTAKMEIEAFLYKSNMAQKRDELANQFAALCADLTKEYNAAGGNIDADTGMVTRVAPPPLGGPNDGKGPVGPSGPK